MSSVLNHLVACYLILFQLTCCQILNQIGRLYIPNVDRESAESVAIAVKAQRLFVADGTNLAIHVISFNSTDSFSSVNMTYEDNIDISTISPEEQSLNITVHDITSIAWSSKDDLVIATIVPLNYAIESGYLLFIDPYNLMITNMIELIGCYLPDMVTTSNNNDTILIACEGEPDNNTISNPDYNPPGSISVIDIVMEDGADNAEYTVTNIGFLDFDEGGSKHKLLPNDTYLPHQNESFSVNAEPEYITCQWNDKYCYITLQENNLIAILEMENREIVNVQSLGIRDFSLYGLDASDRDNGINITRYPRLYGLRAPDALDYFQSVENRHYIITANEGDDKDFDVSRIEDMILDQNVFIGVSVDDLKQQQNLGRLKAINQLGLGQTAGIYEEMYISGSRDFTIYEIKHGDDGISTMSFVYSSKAEFEEVTAVKLGTDGFNGDGYVPSFDTRSDNKGPEPEGIAVGTCGNDRIYAFIGLERANGIMVYEVTDVDNDGVKWVDYVNNINYSIEYNEEERPPRSAGDVSPEQLKFIDEKVYGVPLLFVSNEQSSSITIYRVDCEEVVLDKRGRPLEMWEIILITVGSIIFGVIVIIGSLCCMKKHYANDKSGDTKSTAHLTEADGTKQYDRINTEEVELGTDEVKTENN